MNQVGEAQIREALDQCLQEHVAANPVRRGWSGPLSDDEWDDVARPRTLQAIADGRLTIEAVRDDILRNRRTYNPLARAPRQSGPSPDRVHNRRRRLVHEEAVRQVVAHRAEQDARAHRYRRDILGNSLLTDVRAWLEAQRPRVKLGARSGFSLVPVAVDGETVHRVAHIGSALERLGYVSSALAETYGWDRGEAATFVLTGAPPATPAVKMEVRRSLTTPSLSRIVLTIDPTTTPSEVAAIYGRLRAVEFGWSRVRRLDEKHTKLAVFVYTNGSVSTEDQFVEWNRSHKKWRYRFPAVFKREADLALASLLELRPQRSQP